MNDAERLFGWRNDPLTRANSHETVPITWDQHVSWLLKSLDDPTRAIFIAEVEGDPVGTVRIDRETGCCELTWMVSPEHRRQGNGRRMVQQAAQLVDGPIRARIKVGNISSV